VDQTAQLVLTLSVRYLNCFDGKLRSDVESDEMRGNLRDLEGFPRRIGEMEQSKSAQRKKR